METFEEIDFALAFLIVTDNAQAKLTPYEVSLAFERHNNGDWGELCEHDAAQNERALRTGGRVFSSYRTEAGVSFWIITEGESRVTTVLLPGDY